MSYTLLTTCLYHAFQQLTPPIQSYLMLLARHYQLFTLLLVLGIVPCHFCLQMPRFVHPFRYGFALLMAAVSVEATSNNYLRLRKIILTSCYQLLILEQMSNRAGLLWPLLLPAPPYPLA